MSDLQPEQPCEVARGGLDAPGAGFRPDQATAALAALSEGVIVQAASGEIVSCNPAAERILGLTRDQMAGRTPLDLLGRAIHEDGSPFPGEAHPAMETLRTGESLRGVVMGVQTPEGSVRWISVNSEPIPSPDGKPVSVVTTFTDVTARKLADEAVQRGVSLLRRQAEDGRELRAEELPMQVAVRTGKDVTGFEMGFVSPGGEERTLLGNASPLLGPDGTVQGSVAAFLEITDRKKAAEALRQSEENFRSVIENMQDAYFHADREGRFVLASPSAARMFGFGSVEEMIGTLAVGVYMKPEERERLLRDLRATGRIYDREVEARRRDGSGFWVSMNVQFVRDREGCIVGTEGVVRDVTERKRAEAATLDAEERYRLLAEATSEGVAILDEGRIADCNAQFAAMHGYEVSDLIGRDLVELVAPEEVAALQRHRDAGSIGRHRGIAVRKDGSRFPVEGDERPVPYQGRTVWILALRDLTEQWRAEVEIRQLNAGLEQRVRERTAELEEANRELDAFAHSVSHDLRAPLRAIEGFSEMLVKDSSERLNAEEQRLLDVILTSSRRMSALIGDLLRFSRVSRSEMRKGSIDMTRMAKELVGEIVLDAQGNRFEIRVDELPPSCGDPALVRVALGNLLSNAVKFSGKRERPVIEVGFRPGPGGPEYFVKDNGVGFDSRYTDKLFGVFQRLHDAREFEGTGIGLALVKRIVEKHGGTVRAEGVLGGGATFSFTLGAAAPIPKPPA